MIAVKELCTEELCTNFGHRAGGSMSPSLGRIKVIDHKGHVVASVEVNQRIYTESVRIFLHGYRKLGPKARGLVAAEISRHISMLSCSRL